jgi:hypothetical protein
MIVCYIVGVLIVNPWERVSHDVWILIKKNIYKMQRDSRC